MGKPAVRTGSVKINDSVPITSVFVVEVTAQMAQGDPDGAPLGTTIGVGCVIFHETVVLPSLPTVEPAAVAPGKAGGAVNGVGPDATRGMIVVP